MKRMLKTFSIIFTMIFCILIFKSNAQKNEIHTIPIAMATDNNFIYPTLIAMTSILENKNDDTNLEFNIMISGKVSEENRKRLTSFANFYQNCSVKVIDMQDKFKSTYISISRLTVPTYYRLAIPNVMPEYEKVLYLDGDIMVTTDLWELYNIDIKNNYIAGVKDYGQFLYGSYYAKKLGIKDMNQCINAGILIMNLKQMRQDNMEEKFNDFIPQLKPRKLYLNDQDVLNATCYNKIQFISPEYNAMQHFNFNSNSLPVRILHCYNIEEFKKSCSNPKIVHFTGLDKPWKNCNVKFYNEWDKYRQIAEKNFYEKPIKDGVYKISSALSDKKFLEISEDSKENKSSLHIWDSNSSNTQQFKFTYISEGYYEIESECSGKNLQALGERKNYTVQQNKKNDCDTQKWILKNAENGYYYIISKSNGRYLNVQNAEIKNGTNIQVWNFNGNDAQKFKIF